MSISLRSNNLGTLGYDDYVFRGFVKWFTGIIGYSWDAAISNIANKLNYDNGIGCWPVMWSESTCFRYAKVESIVATYDHLCILGVIPEAKRYDMLTVIVPEVRRYVTFTEEDIRLTLVCLMQYTNNGVIPDKKILFPVSSAGIDKMHIPPPNSDTATSVLDVVGGAIVKAVAGPLASAQTLIWLGVGAAILGGGLIVYRGVKR